MSDNTKPFDINNLQDPDMVGSSEYLAIYEVLETAEDKPHALAILDSFEEHTKAIRETIQNKS